MAYVERIERRLERVRSVIYRCAPRGVTADRSRLVVGVRGGLMARRANRRLSRNRVGSKHYLSAQANRHATERVWILVRALPIPNERRIIVKTLRRCTPGLQLAALAFLAASFVSAPAASAATTTLTFKEPEKGSTLTYVDVAPTAPKVGGLPTSISPGDELVLTNPVTEMGNAIGRLMATCTATAAVAKITILAFAQAHFICEGAYTLPAGTLYVNARVLKSGTEGVVTGGTGKYAGARGTFLSKEGKDGSKTTVALLSE